MEGKQTIMRRSALAAVAAIGSASLLLAGCSKADDNKDTPKAAGANAATKGVVNASDKKGGTVTYEMSDVPDSFDPGNTYYAYMYNFSRLYARPLMTFEPAPGPKGNTLVPNQILAHKLSSDGGKTWGAETMDVGMPGGVERPGMAVVARLADKRYVINYEDIDGPNNGQIHLKFSSDGLHFGDPADHGTAVQTEGGAWPAACPVVSWFPVGGAQGVIVVSGERAGGNGDAAGRSLYWNNDGGAGPWWEVPAPVQKSTGNIHAGWTQALLLQPDGSFLHITSSSAPELEHAWKAAYNVMLYADAPLDFNRYEAEDAARTHAVVIGNQKASNRRMARIAAAPYGKLQFDIHRDKGGAHVLRLRYEEMGMPATPRVSVNGVPVATGSSKPDGNSGWNVMDVKADLRDGDNTIVVGGAEHVYDLDYIQVE
jgi:hypothetical protein